MSQNQAKIPEKLTCFFLEAEFGGLRAPRGREAEHLRVRGEVRPIQRSDLGGYRTVIDKGAFDKVLETADVRLLVNHDDNLLMGRTSSGTLRLSVDGDGIYFEGDPPDSDLSRHYMAAIERGDMDGCSFSCAIDVDQWDFSGETPVRTLMSLSQLYDVGPVTYPAFRDTSVTVSHALEAARAAMVVKLLRPSFGLGLMRLGIEIAR